VDADAGTPAQDGRLPRGTIVLLTAAGAVLVIAGLHEIADIIAPVFLALVLTVAVHPMDGILRRWGAKPWAALLLTLVTIYLILIGLAAAAAFSLARLATELPQYKGRGQELIDNVSQTLSNLGVGSQQINAALGNIDIDKVVSELLDVLDGLLAVTGSLVLVVTVLFFMALDAVGFTARLRSVGRAGLAPALSGFASGTRRYLVVSTVFGLIVAVLDTIALTLIGVPLPVVWGLFSFITNYVPNIGFVIGLIPPALLGLLDGGPWTMLAVIAVYCVINVIIQSVIQPKVVGDVVGLTATLSFVSLIFWTWVIGPLGAILAIPLSVLAKAVLLDMDPRAHWLSVLVSPGSPAASPPGPPVASPSGPPPDGRLAGTQSDTTPPAGQPPTQPAPADTPSAEPSPG
jgi:predicted PurR-regulated permease PerM